MFDANGTTLMQPEVQQEFLKWTNKGNPSSSYAIAAQQLIANFTKQLESLSNKKVIWTSGASEANAQIINHFCDIGTTHHTPHVVTSAIEHKSVLLHLEALSLQKRITLTYVLPVNGVITAAAVADAIQPNTVLVVVMCANNETGIFSEFKQISALCRQRRIHYHMDTTQTFGKYPETVAVADSTVISFHKLGGPPGIGCLLTNITPTPLIYGTQNDSLRGGTENVPGIGAAQLATRISITNRKLKNDKLSAHKKRIMLSLSAKFRCVYLADYSPTNTPLVVFLSPTANCLPNTILLSLVKPPPYICNTDMKNALFKKGIVVSIGSACNTNSPKASHVLYSMQVDELIRKGTLRISLSDQNTYDEVTYLIDNLITVFNNELKAKK